VDLLERKIIISYQFLERMLSVPTDACRRKPLAIQKVSNSSKLFVTHSGKMRAVMILEFRNRRSEAVI